MNQISGAPRAASGTSSSHIFVEAAGVTSGNSTSDRTGDGGDGGGGEGGGGGAQEGVAASDEAEKTGKSQNVFDAFDQTQHSNHDRRQQQAIQLSGDQQQEYEARITRRSQAGRKPSVDSTEDSSEWEDGGGVGPGGSDPPVGSCSDYSTGTTSACGGGLLWQQRRLPPIQVCMLLPCCYERTHICASLGDIIARNVMLILGQT